MATEQQYLQQIVGAAGKKELINPHTGKPMEWGDASSLLGRVSGQGNTIDNRLLSMAGLWKPEYDQLTSDWGTDPSSRSQARQAWQGSAEYGELADKLKGYTYGEARKDHTVFDVLRDPQGNVVAMQPRMNKGKSFHKDDYANMATVMLGGVGAAAGGAAGVGSSLYGMGGAAGAAAGGATLGAAGGAIQAYGNDQNVLKGAVVGGLMGGAAGYAGASFGGASDTGAATTGAAAPSTTGSPGLSDASFSTPTNSFTLDPNGPLGPGFGVQFGGAGSMGIDGNTLALNTAGGGGMQPLPREFGGFQQTSGELPQSTSTESAPPKGTYAEMGADGLPQTVNTNDFAGTQPTSNNTLGDFFSGDGKMGDYIQLGGLVASIAARPKAPDTSGINAAAQSSAAVAARQQDLAEKQYADQMALLNEYKPMLQKQLQNSIDEQAKSSGRADQQWSDYMKTWRPVETTLADKSMNWASDGRMQQAAQEAQAGVATQYDGARQQSREQMIAAGLDPSTIATIQASTGALEAKDRAGAANTARRTVESQGMAYLDNAARFGRNMPSTGLAAAGLAGAQGQQAQSGYSGLVNATAAPSQASTPLFSSAIGGNNSAGSLYGNAAQLNNQSALQNYNATMGTIAGLNQWYQSSKKIKKVHGKVKGAADAVEKSGASKWSYKPGLGDGDTKMRMGPMAEDLQREAPSVSNGKRVDAISLMGLHHAAIGENTKKGREQERRIARLERKLSLANA
jgi:hypothetical protein